MCATPSSAISSFTADRSVRSTCAYSKMAPVKSVSAQSDNFAFVPSEFVETTCGLALPSPPSTSAEWKSAWCCGAGRHCSGSISSSHLGDISPPACIARAPLMVTLVNVAAWKLAVEISAPLKSTSVRLVRSSRAPRRDARPMNGVL